MDKYKPDGIDNLYFLIRGNFKDIKRDFKKIFRYSGNTGKFYHGSGADMKLYEGKLPGMRFIHLPKAMREEFSRTYTMSGIIRAPIKKEYGTVVPFQQDIFFYCLENQMRYAFSAIKSNFFITYNKTDGLCMFNIADGAKEGMPIMSSDELVGHLERRDVKSPPKSNLERRVLRQSDIIQKTSPFIGSGN